MAEEGHMSEEKDDFLIEEEIDGDLEIFRSKDNRYVEIRITSNKEITAEGVVAILETLAMMHGPDPDKLFEVFGKPMPDANDMN